MKLINSCCIAAGLLGFQVTAQTFQRLGACPTLGCIFPPDQANFLPGQWFDIRLEVHAPQNGSERVPHANPDQNYTFTIARNGQQGQPAAQFFNASAPTVSTWNFTWYEDLFAQAAGTPSFVKVAGSIYRKVALYQPGFYTATLAYQNGSETVANWTVRDIPTQRRAKNTVMFIGDGMTTNMITAVSIHTILEETFADLRRHD